MLNYLLVTFTAVLLICSPSSSIAQESSSTPDAPQADSAIETAPESVRVDELVDDAAIKQRLTRILNSTEWFQSVNVRVENGVV